MDWTFLVWATCGTTCAAQVGDYMSSRASSPRRLSVSISCALASTSCVPGDANPAGRIWRPVARIFDCFSGPCLPCEAMRLGKLTKPRPWLTPQRHSKFCALFLSSIGLLQFYHEIASRRSQRSHGLLIIARTSRRVAISAHINPAEMLTANSSLFLNRCKYPPKSC
jgi:hypothetical protein